MQNNLVLRRLAQVGALGVLALLGLFDVLAGGMFRNEPTALSLLRIMLAVGAAAIWLPEHRHN